jgi:hypothetical protein
MSKRAIYSIPLAGLALTSIGCPIEEPPVVEDEVLDSSFAVNVINAYEVPYLNVAVDINGDGTLICDISYASTDVTFAAGVGATTYTVDQTNCLLNGVDDPASNVNLATVAFSVVATAVAINAQYDITLTDADGVAVELACTFAGGILDCGDLVLAAN